MSKMPNFLSLIRNKIPRHFTQVMATLAVSLGPFAAGLGKGYSSPALASLQESKASSFHVSAQEGSWVASLSLLGALFGCLVGGLMLQVGRKRSLLCVALPFSGSWLLTVFAKRVEMMYCTSFIGGFLSAVTLLATQVYVSEIAQSEIRGCLSAVLAMAGEIGTLSSFTLGAFLDWRQLATFAAGGPILFFFAILLIPETPSFLLYHGREEEACKAMTWLRSSKDDVASEMATLRSNISTKHKSFFPKCSSQFPFRSLFVTCGLMFFQKFSGVTVFHHYAVPIFKQVFGRSIDAHWAAIVVVLLRLLGSMTSGLLIDTVGRLPLLIISNLFISASFFGFGLYNWMEESLPANYPGFGPSFDWIPLTCVLFFTLFFSIGIGPISWLMVGELFPLQYRYAKPINIGFGAAVSTSFSYACAFTAVKTYVDIRASVGLYGAFWIYSAISIAGLFFVCCLVPETKGVELEEMHHGDSISVLKISQTQPTNIISDENSHKLHFKRFSNACEHQEMVNGNTCSQVRFQSPCTGGVHVSCTNNPFPPEKLPSTTCLNLTQHVSYCQPISKVCSKSCANSYNNDVELVPIEHNINPSQSYHQYNTFCHVPSNISLHQRTTLGHHQPHHSHLPSHPCSLSFRRAQLPDEIIRPIKMEFRSGIRHSHHHPAEHLLNNYNSIRLNNCNHIMGSTLSTEGLHYDRKIRGTIV